MFTGLVEEVGTIKSIEPIGANQSKLVISCQMIQEGMKLGDSVAVNGVCLTVIRFDSQKIDVELSTETLKKSLFSKKGTGTIVNLERALQVGDRLGGHIVQGHVDSLATVLQIDKTGDFYEIAFSLNTDISRYLVDKGSITIDGISLTIAKLTETDFSVAIIPHTFQNTALSSLQPGSAVHIETDIIARYIERLLPFQQQEAQKADITPEFLRKHGF